MSKLWDEIKFGHAFLGFVKNPSPAAAFALSDVVLRMKDTAPAENVAENALRHRGFRQLFEQGYAPPPVDLNELRTCPQGSLGRSFLDHIETLGLQVDFYPPRDPRTAIGYFALRELQTHDIFHVLTGYTTSLDDELALQAFMLGQHGSGLSAAILAGGILHQIRTSPGGAADLMAKLGEGFTRGKRAQFLLGTDWEERWSEPLKKLKQEARLNS
jgi:ubiquinone biosynthesis protein COQ4